MTQNADFFKTISTLDMPGTGKLIVLAILTHKTYDVAKLMELTGENRRTVQLYRLQWMAAQDETSETRAICFAQDAKDAQPVSCDVVELIPAPIEEHARLIEKPLVLSSSEVEEENNIVRLPLPTNPRAQGTNPRAKGAKDELAIQFEQFWSIFPAGRKRAKGKCRELFICIAANRHRTLEATADRMIDAARRYAESRPNPDYVPMPLTWLNQGRWEDDIEPVRRQSAAPQKQLALPNPGAQEAQMAAELQRMVAKSINGYGGQS